jgi:peptide-methionine (S)-S-oxide reductase
MQALIERTERQVLPSFLRRGGREADGVVGREAQARQRAALRKVAKPPYGFPRSAPIFSKLPTAPSGPLRWLRYIFLMAQPPRLRKAGSTFPLIAILIFCLCATSACGKADAAAAIPAPAVDEARGGPNADRVAVFAGGCFWGIDAVFKHVKGVKNATSGYAGGTAATAHYPIVSEGTTGHAESVQVVYDPSQISYGQLLQVFFSVAHDPTQMNRQGPDQGTQYRSEIFFASPEQQKVALAYIDQLNKVKAFNRSIVTRVEPLAMFYPAEAYHQNYAANHPNDLYIVINDAPKVGHLREQFPQLYKGK